MILWLTSHRKKNTAKEENIQSVCSFLFSNIYLFIICSINITLFSCPTFGVHRILPPCFRRIRHYGLLSNASKTKSLAAARKSLGLKAQERSNRATRKALARERLLGQNPDCCRSCKAGTMQRVAILPPTRAPPNSATDMQHAVWI
jgi:hypothetical protein